jgi:hypothetical protein
VVPETHIMASRQPQKSLGDYLAIAICPFLIMALVSSLVFFLLEVLYVGLYQGRLQWILFAFVFAAVLIARMSMPDGVPDRAPFYGVILAIVVWLALLRFVDFPPETPLAGLAWAVNLALMGVIWWCAHRLTWDCTLIDDRVDASGAGLLETAGLEAAPDQPNPAASSTDSQADMEELPERSGLPGWWDRFRRYREERGKQPHATGVWIVYFSLAALPLFGLGQSLIPAAEAGRRRYVFWLMSIYLASGLGLLLTTSFLGLRRYLRQRKLEMPGATTRVWLTIGGMLILLLLAAGAFLPRPNAEYPLIQLPFQADSPDRLASRHAIKGGGAGKGEGRPGGVQPGQQKDGEQGQGGRDAGQGQKQHGGDPSDGGQGKDGQGKDAQGKDGQGGDGQGKDGQGKGGQDQAKGDEKNGQGKDAADQNREQVGDDKNARDKPATAKKDAEAKGGQGQARPGEKEKGAGSTGHSPPREWVPPALQSVFRGLLTLIKWIVFAILALLVAFVLFRSFVKFLANFTHWARALLASLESLWQALFGWMNRETAAPTEADPEAEVRAARAPFSAFRNPFTGGSRRRSPEDLIRYSFEALEAWGHEHNLGRKADETPLEFADRLGQEYPALEKDARRLATLYARAAYADGPLPGTTLGVLWQFWKCLEAVVEAPMSA